MGNTPNLSLPYPELTDTAHVPRDMKALADKLDVLLGGGGSGGGGGGGVGIGSNLPILDVGMAGQVRAGRQLAVADFTSIGLTAPVGLFNLSGLANQGTDARPLVNLGAVPFGVGINGAATTAAVFAGSTGQALYIADSGTSDPFRIGTGSWGCWLRTAKRGVGAQSFLAKASAAPGGYVFGCYIHSSGTLRGWVSTDGTTTSPETTGVIDVADDRWHHVVFTFDGAAHRLYVDAAPEATVAFAGVLFAGNGPLNIGGQSADATHAAANPHYGRVDEAFVTADVLTEDQIRSLYAARLTHTLGAIPAAARVNVHRRRRGSPFAVADFPTQPLRLHNFDATVNGGLSDEGSGAVNLTWNNGADTAGVDGRKRHAYHFTGGAGGLSATDAGLPGGLTARSYGAWFRLTDYAANRTILNWGSAPGTADARLYINGGAGSGQITSGSGGDNIVGVFASDGQWHFAVVVEDSTAGDGCKRKLYLDGRLVGSSTVLNTLTLAGANRFRIGAASDGAQPFVGQIDGAFVTNYPLAVADIIGLYNRGTQDLGVSPKNPGDHVERLDATSVLFIGDSLEGQHNVDVGVIG